MAASGLTRLVGWGIVRLAALVSVKSAGRLEFLLWCLLPRMREVRSTSQVAVIEWRGWRTHAKGYGVSSRAAIVAHNNVVSGTGR